MKGKKRVLFYLVDGAHIDVLSELISKGELLNMKRIMDEGTYRKATVYDILCSQSGWQWFR